MSTIIYFVGLLMMLPAAISCFLICGFIFSDDPSNQKIGWLSIAGFVIGGILVTSFG